MTGSHSELRNCQW